MAKELKNILINRIHDKQLLDYAERYLSGNLLDIGCGTKPYKDILAPFVEAHVGVDHEDTFHDKSNIDLFGVLSLAGIFYFGIVFEAEMA